LSWHLGTDPSRQEVSNYIDSSGIGERVSAFTFVRNQGGEMKLLHLTKKTHDLLQITKLYTVFHVLDDERCHSRFRQLGRHDMKTVPEMYAYGKNAPALTGLKLALLSMSQIGDVTTTSRRGWVLFCK